MLTRFIFCIGLILLSFLQGAGQGTIVGTITDQSSGEVLISAYVLAIDRQEIVTSDFDGKYALSLPEGVYALRVTYIGFADKIITDIQVTDGRVTYLDLALQPDSEELEEVVISARALERSENAVLLLRKRSDRIQDGISSQEMSRLAAGDAASAMTKVTGASVEDGKYVVVRGLGDRYSITMLNDLPLPSIDPYRNSAQLDLIPTDLLDNIITSKTFTPDQPGTFTGGSVNIKTRSFPEQQTLTLSLSTGVNTQSSFRDGFLTHPGGRLDWLGYDRGLRKRPVILSSEAFAQYSDQNAELKARFGDEEAASTIQSVVDAVDLRFDTLHKHSFTDYGFTIAYGNSYNTGGHTRLGVIAAMSHQNNYDHRANMVSASYLAMLDNQGTPFLRTNGDYRITESQETPVVNGLVGLAYKFDGLNSIDFKVMYNHSTTKSTSFVIGEDGDNIEDPLFKLGRALQFEERAMLNYQLAGRHVFAELKNMEVSYGAGYVHATKEEPNLRYLTSQWNAQTGMHGIPLANVNDPFLFWRDLRDEIVNFKLDLSVPFRSQGGTGSYLKVGGFVSRKDRDFNEYQYRTVRSQFANAYNGDPDTFFGPDNTGIINQEGQPNGTMKYFIGNYVTEATSPRNSYLGHEDVAALYGMLALRPLPALKMVTGVRLETTDMHVQSKIVTHGIADADSTNTGVIRASDLLPSFSLVYAITESMNLRASYAHTIARPNLREIAPFASFDPIIDQFYNGNPQLKKTSIRNVDVRWEWFINPGEVIAVSAFRKTFEDPIVIQYLVSTNPEFIFVNADQGEISGIELELRKDLGFLSDQLANFKVSTNLALIRSSTDVVSSFAVRQRQRPFVGQSDVLANVILNYNHADHGLDLTMICNFTGDRLAEIGQLTESAPPTDIYERSVRNLDLIASKQFGRVRIKCSAKNLLNPDLIRYIPFGNTETVTGRFRKGRTFSISAQIGL
ncbi:MAG: TonB-dependent receptor [Saprospiraceae bacterium]|nr:TonB-dependent receptor [Saprospiraceae bacterium]